MGDRNVSSTHRLRIRDRRRHQRDTKEALRYSTRYTDGYAKCTRCRCNSVRTKDAQVQAKPMSIIKLQTNAKTIDACTQTPPLSEISLEAEMIWGGEALTKLKTTAVKHKLKLPGPDPHPRKYISLSDRFKGVTAITGRWLCQCHFGGRINNEAHPLVWSDFHTIYAHLVFTTNMRY